MNTPADLQHYMRPGTLRLPSLPPLALYLHLPWCLKKCPYCDFNSHEITPTVAHSVSLPAPRGGAAGLGGAGAGFPIAPTVAHSVSLPAPRGGAAGLGRPGAGGFATDLAGTLPEDRYIDALLADLEAALPLVWGRMVQTIFIGGGTPSLFSPAAIERLLSAVRARLRLVADCEITLEANPGTFEKDRFKAFKSAGVTRLSIGVQSFDDRFLRALGRVHDGAQAIAAVEEAAGAFDTFNLDLMYALPGQTLEDLNRDLAQALQLRPPHLSIYHLTIEPNTYFAKFPPALPEDDLAYAMLDRITEAAGSVGLNRYEVSAYAQAGHACKHNLNYWGFGDYLGLGAGAHSKLSFAHRVVRQTRLRDPKTYMQAALGQGAAPSPIAQTSEVSRADLPFEFMLNALRLKDGFKLQDFADRTGLGFGAIEKALLAAEQKGLIQRDFEWAKPTARGFDFLNDLQALFLPA